MNPYLRELVTVPTVFAGAWMVFSQVPHDGHAMLLVLPGVLLMVLSAYIRGITYRA